jgi:Zn finger protein HypA/HybF involved in hydrogenase expression
MLREHHILQAIFQQILSQQPQHVRLVMGALFELDEAAVRAYWAELSRGTALEQAQLRIRLIPAEVQCMACFSKYQPEGRALACPHCGSFGAKVLTGTECILDPVEADHA